jgi:glucose/arabinose dehydrogenase
VDGARLAAWTPDGRLLVSRPDAGDVQVLTPRADRGAPPRITTLVRGLTLPHGLAFTGDTLLVAESDRVDAYRYADGAVSGRRTVVDGLPDASTPELRGAYAHALKSVAVGRDGAVYVSVGSTGNTSAEDRTASPERAAILRIEDGRATTFARGVRNGTGLAIAPDGSVWTAVNNRDQVAYPYDRSYTGGGGSDLGRVLTGYVNDHPLEPVARLTQGRDLGWPYCNPDPDVDPGAPGTALTYTDRGFVRDRELNADGSKLDCGRLPRVEQGLPAHSAPLGMAFVRDGVLPSPWGAGALVGVHGSWNRTPPRPPSVAFLPWRHGTLQAARTLLAGFQAADGSRWGRPVAAVAGPDGAVYVTDDAAGAVYRMVPD